ncbi:hypothetical protein [uncultured Georgenia sp.]|uniref:hypothetical protein n=1 Tax=uncultured Georgenia sp. TaxID=378209 RepID=UPI002628218E|nr:hypothetical protein [uncultured Georgenia sp.]HLV04985.1 hypothetical protein [Actinomycetaceae bacterium]
MTRRRHRRVVAPTTRLGPSEEGRLIPAEAVPPRPPRTEAEPAAPPEEAAAAAGPALPTRAREDTDEAWGELPEGSDDARYLRDRPPHWG